MSVTRTICAISARVVVMSNFGRQLLIDVYGVDEKKIAFIPHGVPDRPFAHSLADAKTKVGLQASTPVMTTYGLIGRNKNIELALKALQIAVKSIQNLTYMVIGETHPLVKLSEGESYRRELESKVAALNLTDNVRFIDRYMNNDELLTYLDVTDIYLTPYAMEGQYVSSALSWAVGLGKCPVLIPYTYAKELLKDGRGFLVPFNDHRSLSSLIIKLFQDYEFLNAVRRRAYIFGRCMTWTSVGIRLQKLCLEILSSA